MNKATVVEEPVPSYPMIEGLKVEVARLQAIKEGLEKEIEGKRLSWNQKVDAQMEQIRLDKVKVSEEKTALEQAKAEFEKVLAAFKKDQAANVGHREAAVIARNEYAEKEARINQFMRVIREEAAKL